MIDRLINVGVLDLLEKHIFVYNKLVDQLINCTLIERRINRIIPVQASGSSDG